VGIVRATFLLRENARPVHRGAFPTFVKCGTKADPEESEWYKSGTFIGARSNQHALKSIAFISLRVPSRCHRPPCPPLPSPVGQWLYLGPIERVQASCPRRSRRSPPRIDLWSRPSIAADGSVFFRNGPEADTDNEEKGHDIPTSIDDVHSPADVSQANWHYVDEN
jgi:hypothetical protein